MPVEYLPIMAQSAGPNSPRVLVSPSQPAWCPLTKPLKRSRVALLSSAALRLKRQKSFSSREDLTYRSIPSDPDAGDLVIDHPSKIGTVPRQDPEIVFPRTALAALVNKQVVGSLSPFHVSFKGGTRQHFEIENELGPALARELKQAGVEVALLVPY